MIQNQLCLNKLIWDFVDEWHLDYLKWYAHLHDLNDARPTFKILRLIALFEVEMAMLGLHLKDQGLNLGFRKQFMSKTLEIVP